MAVSKTTVEAILGMSLDGNTWTAVDAVVRASIQAQLAAPIADITTPRDVGIFDTVYLSTAIRLISNPTGTAATSIEGLYTQHSGVSGVQLTAAEVAQLKGISAGRTTNTSRSRSVSWDAGVW